MGVYIGNANNVTCQGDHCTYEIILCAAGKCSIECIPQLSYFKGGQPPWHAEGTWEMDDTDVIISITKQDVTGPRNDSDITLPMQTNGSLKYRGVECKWKQPPPGVDPKKIEQEAFARELEEAKQKQAEIEAQREELRKLQEQQAAQQAELQRQQQELIAKREQAALAAKQQQDELEQQRAELRALEEQREEAERKQREEAQRLREEQEAELARAEEDRKGMATEHEAQQKEIERKRAELQAERDTAAQKNREDMERWQEECAARTKEFEEKRAHLMAQQHEVESNRAANEAERASKIEELKIKDAELQEERAEVERRRQEEENLRLAHEETFKLRDKELEDRDRELENRAGEMCEMEELQVMEHRKLLQSRKELFMVQSHVLSSIGTNNTNSHETHVLNAADDMEGNVNEPEDDQQDGGDDVWDQDWTAVRLGAK